MVHIGQEYLFWESGDMLYELASVSSSVLEKSLAENVAHEQVDYSHVVLARFDQLLSQCMMTIVTNGQQRRRVRDSPR